MKHALLFLSFIFLLCGCQKMESRLQGKFYCDTVDGMLYVELLNGGNCIAYFNGGEEDAGYWHVLDGNEISIIANVKLRKSSHISVSYWFDGHGTIKDADSFSVPVKRYRYSGFSSEEEMKTLYFNRR